MSRFAQLVSGILCLALLPACTGYRRTFSSTLAVGEEFTDNVDASSENPQSDLISSITPSLTWAATNPKRELSLTYSPSFEYYAKTRSDFFTSHNAGLNAVNRFSRHATLELIDDFSLSNDPAVTREIEFSRGEQPQQPEDNTRRQGRESYYTNSATAAFRYAFGRDDSFFVSYQNATLQNEDPTVEDSTSQVPSVGVTYWLTPRYGIDAQATYNRGDFSLDTSPFNEYQLSSRFIRRFNAQWDTFLHYNHTIMTFQDENNSQGENENYQVYEATIGVDYHPSQNTFFSLSTGFFVRAPEEMGSQAGYVLRGDMARQFNWGAVRLSGGTGYRQTYFATENLGFTEYYEGTLAGNYNFTRQISGIGSVAYTHNNYTDEAGRKDDIITLQVGVSYLIRQWLSSSLSFTHHKFESTEPGDSYDENRITLSLTFTPLRPWVLE